MERKANYTLVGFATLLLIIAAVAFAFWLARFQFNRDFDLYDIRFVGPVNGLSQGGEARFNGIKVGEVTNIALDRRDPSLVVARIRVNSDVPIKTDSYATLEPQNITGVSYVQIAAGSTQAHLLKDVTPRGQVPLLRSQPSQLSNLLEGGGTLLARAVEALDRVNRVLSDKNITTFNSTLSDINVVTAELKNQKEVFGDARSTLQEISKTADQYAELAKHLQTLVDTDGKSTLQNASQAASEIRAAAADARQLVASLKGPTTDFATNGLPQLQSAIISLQGTAESLERLANELESNPRAMISKEPAKEIKVKP
ncbi:MAG TPA: MlaD family protein [Caulobacteraceae bacterium]|nr:MlaD family protein [Caulobacteraceae bacterium]